MSFYLMNFGILLAIFVVLGVSYNLLLGYTGLLSIAHAAFFGIGAYTSGILMRDGGLGFLESLFAALVVGAVLGALLGWPARRVNGIYLVLMTLGFQYVVIELIGTLEFTGGQNGLVGIPMATIGGELLGRNGLFAVAWILCLLITFLTRSAVKSPFGRLLEAVREDELAARSLGKRTGAAKMQAFIVSSAIASLAGGLYAQYLLFINPGAFDIHQSIHILAIVIIGGLGVFWGPYFGAIIVVGVPELLTFIGMPSSIVGGVNTVAFSVILLIILLFRPKGLAFSVPIRRRRGAPVVADDSKPADSERARRSVTLEVREASIAFGGLKAVQDVSLTLRPGQITGLIGPNGAGKTTLFNIISGVLDPDEGDVLLDGERLNGLPLEERARKGVVRSFQDMKIFMGMTCEQNLLLPATPRDHEQVLTAAVRSRRAEPRRREAAREMLGRLGLSDVANKTARNLSYAEQKRLMIGRLLATDADCYLLDEPMSGLDDEGRATILELLRGLADAGATICLVEHSLSVIESVCSRVAFLMDGKLVKEGPCAEILRDPELVELYFGSPEPSGERPSVAISGNPATA